VAVSARARFDSPASESAKVSRISMSSISVSECEILSSKGMMPEGDGPVAQRVARSGQQAGHRAIGRAVFAVIESRTEKMDVSKIESVIMYRLPDATPPASPFFGRP